MKNLWKKFKSGLFTKTQFITGVTITLVTTSALVYAFNQLSLNIFSSGQPISSAQVNANFEYLNERMKYLAGNQFEVSSPYSVTPKAVSSNTTVAIEFNNVVADFTDNNSGKELVDYGQFTIPKTGGYQISYHAEFANNVDTTKNIQAKIFMEYNSLGVGSFSSLPCCAPEASIYINSMEQDANFKSVVKNSGTASFMAGDIIRFRVGVYSYSKDVDITNLKIKVSSQD